MVTAAVKEVPFAKLMKIGDMLCIYTHVERVGLTSMTLKVEAWAQRYLFDLMEKVTHSDFVMALLDGEGKPEAVPAECGVRGHFSFGFACLDTSIVTGPHLRMKGAESVGNPCLYVRGTRDDPSVGGFLDRFLVT